MSIEQQLQDKGLNSPRLDPTHIANTIVGESFHKLTNVLTVCVLTLRNGYTVTGESACASPENYDQDIGEQIAKSNAVEKVWNLEGYLLKQHLYEDANAVSEYLHKE